MTIADEIRNDWLDGLLTQRDVVFRGVNEWSRGRVDEIQCFDTASEEPIVWTFVFNDGSVLETPLVVVEHDCG